MAVAKSLTWIALLALVFLACSGTARADYLEFNNVEAADTVYISYGSFSNLDVYDGQYSISVSPNSSFNPEDMYNTFCVDLNDEVGNGQKYAVNIIPTSNGLADGAQIAYLYNTYGIGTINGGGSYTIGSYTGVSGSDVAAGLQLAISDELANGGATTGPLTYHGESSTVDNLVTFFLAAAAANSAGSVAGWANSNGSAQLLDLPPLVLGQSFLVPATIIQTPEPSTLTLVGLGLACLAACRARRSKRAAR